MNAFYSRLILSRFHYEDVIGLLKTVNLLKVFFFPVERPLSAGDVLGSSVS
jgi:hypothetical protein